MQPRQPQLTNIGARAAVIRQVPWGGALAWDGHRHCQYLGARLFAEISIAVRAGFEGALHSLLLAVRQTLKQRCFKLLRRCCRAFAAHLSTHSSNVCRVGHRFKRSVNTLANDRSCPIT